MARIRTYDLDTTISDNDYLLGNDGDNGSVVTKRFPLEDLKEFVLDGSSIDILRRIPPRHLLVVNEAGDNIDRAPLQVSYTPIDRDSDRLNEDGHLDLLSAGEGTSRIDYRSDINGNPELRFINYNLEYVLESFVGTVVNFNTQNEGPETANSLTATVKAYIPYDPDVNVLNDIGDVSDVFILDFGDIVPPNGIQATNAVDRIAIVEPNETTGAFAVLSELQLSSLVVTGGMNIDGDLNVGSDEDRSNINLAGFLKFNDIQEGIQFGSDDNNITFTSDAAGNLRIAELGSGMINFDVPVNFSGGVNLEEMVFEDTDSLTRINADGVFLTDKTNNTVKVLQSVVANDTSGTPAPQLLTSINIDGTTFSLPSFDASAVIEAFPGLNEALSGPTEEITTGSFFYGTQSANDVTPTSPIDSAVINVVVPEGATSITLSGADKTAFEAWYDLTDPDVPYFLDNTQPAPTVGTPIDSTTIPVYMIVGYNSTTGVLTLGLLGSGAVNISSQTFNLSSSEIIVANLPDEDELEYNFVTVGDDNILSKTDLNIMGSANGAHYTIPDEGVATPQALSSITFEGDHNVSQGDTTGSVIVDVSGRYRAPIQGAVFGDGGGVTETFTLNILDTITEPATLELPVAQEFGDSIKIVNVSNFSETGADTTSSTWSIYPGGTNRIMKQPQGQTLTLDDSTASFELVWSGVAEIGWVIIGID